MRIDFNMLELINESDCRKPVIGIKNDCTGKKCYSCERFGRCLIKNDGGELLPRDYIVRK